MKRVEAASGANYSTHNESTRKFEPIVPVGTNYTPVGKVDMAALKKTPAPAAKPVLPTRPIFGAPASSAGSLYGKAASSGSAAAWQGQAEKTTKTMATPPISTRPPIVPATTRPTFSAMTPTKPSPDSAFSALGSTPSSRSAAAPPPISNAPTKPEEEDRIQSNKSAWTPVSLPPPKKLKNPFAAMEQQTPTQLSPTRSGTGASKKLTWSERQALARQKLEDEEARSRAAGFVPPAAASKPVFKSTAPSFGKASVLQSTPRNFGAVHAVASAGVSAVVGATTPSATVLPSPSPPPPPAATRPVPAYPLFVEQLGPGVRIISSMISVFLLVFLSLLRLRHRLRRQDPFSHTLNLWNSRSPR